jgi:hypothetical protein
MQLPSDPAECGDSSSKAARGETSGPAGSQTTGEADSTMNEDGVPTWCIFVLLAASWCFGFICGLAGKILFYDMWRYESWEDQVFGLTIEEKAKMRREKLKQ